MTEPEPEPELTAADRAQQIAQLGRPRLKTKSALSYFGSDSEVAGPLAAMLNHCRHVTIPFCGGLSILPHLTARAIVANDAHWQVINFYRFASGRFGQAAQRELLPKVADRPDCGIYCDPPWVELGKNYLHTFAAEDHSELEFLLRRFKSATIVIRYGDCATVRDLYSDSRWHITPATSRAQSNANKPELWITNRPPAGN